ncbi:MAG: pilus assembly protein PilN [Gammaproteobacteria bacterium]|nr:MAG: pilus assembly protein PilN [Gammaproteobacteria bacterium]
MAKINLLPWREELRKERQQAFYTTIGVFAVLTLCIWGAFHFYNTLRIDYQVSRNDFINVEIVKLEKKIEEIKRLEKEKKRLKARIDAIERLQGNRPLIVHLFDEMVTSLPEGVSIKSVKQKGPSITISGVAQSNARVSSFMRKLKASAWLGDPQLDVIQAQNEQGQRVSNFTMRFNQVIPKASTEEDDA